jgi:coenzyme F420 hydrogenase subunit beta
MNNNTIAQVVKDGLCTGCGTCIALCPEEAIELTIDKKKGTYVPTLNEEKCNNCGTCYKICPGHEVDFKALNLEIFGKKPEDILIGNYLNCYVSHSTDYDIRYNSASGGLVTQLLIFALEEGIIDGTLVTRMKKDKPLEPEPFIARTKEEVIEASKSKYCPVPANIALKEILESEEGEKFAVVGLPCHIHGIRKAEQINKKLKQKIVLHLGIFCNHAPNFWGTKLLLQRLKVKEDEVMKLDYRGEGYPGSMRISQKSGELLLLPDYWSFVGAYFFYPARCLLCNDEICELADISFGDAWLPELSDDKIGKSIVVSKSEIGEKILQKVKSKNEIELNEVDVKKVVQSQVGMLYFKKRDLNARSKLFKVVPKYNIQNNLLEPDVIDRLLVFFPYLNSYASSKSVLRKVLCHIPTKLIRLYGVPYALIHSKKVKRDFKKFL